MATRVASSMPESHYAAGHRPDDNPRIRLKRAIEERDILFDEIMAAATVPPPRRHRSPVDPRLRVAEE